MTLSQIEGTYYTEKTLTRWKIEREFEVTGSKREMEVERNSTGMLYQVRVAMATVKTKNKIPVASQKRLSFT